MEPLLRQRNGLTVEYPYSGPLIKKIDNDAGLLDLFKILFNYIYVTGLIAIVSKQSDLDVMERMFIKSKNEYVKGVEFTAKEHLSNFQVFSIQEYLKKDSKSLEPAITSFIEAINERVSPNVFEFNLPKENTSYLEGIRTILTEFESLLKQYQYLIEEGEINYELIRLNSKPMIIGEVKSTKPSKYLYSVGDELTHLLQVYYSD